MHLILVSDQELAGNVSIPIVTTGVFSGKVEDTPVSEFVFVAYNNILVFAIGKEISLKGEINSNNNNGLNNHIVNPNFVNVAISNDWLATNDLTLQAGLQAPDSGSDRTGTGIFSSTYQFPDTNFVFKTTASPVSIIGGTNAGKNYDREQLIM